MSLMEFDGKASAKSDPGLVLGKAPELVEQMFEDLDAHGPLQDAGAGLWRGGMVVNGQGSLYYESVQWAARFEFVELREGVIAFTEKGRQLMEKIQSGGVALDALRREEEERVQAEAQAKKEEDVDEEEI